MVPDISGRSTTRSRYITLVLLLLAGASIQAAPAADFGLSATPVSTSQINLSWDDVSGAAQFAIDRRVGSSGAFSQIQIVDKSLTTFSNGGLASSTTYNYQIRAIRNNNETFATSVIAGATTFTPPDTTPPTVSITSPASGTTYTTSQTVTLTAAAGDNVGVTRVDFYRNSVLQGSDTTAPYNRSWPVNQSVNGTHSWYARAFDAAGNAANSPSISLTVNIGSGDTTPPTVSITSPASGTTYTTSQTVTLTASAGDNVGVTKVDFYRNSVLQGSDTTAPYNRSWPVDQSVNGTHSWYARAFDAAGNAANSPSISLTVNIGSGPDTTPPTTPTGLAASVISCTQINVSWLPSFDAGSGVAGYRIYRNSIFIGTTPLAFFNDTSAEASTFYSYRVAAYDVAGNLSSTSAFVSATTPSCGGAIDSTPPSVPTGLSATPIGCSQVNLSWNPSTDTGGSGLEGYRLYRNGTYIGAATTGSTSWIDLSVAASTAYSYRVAAYDGSGNQSSQSSPASATTPSCTNSPPVANAGLNQTITVGDSVTLNGSGSSDPGGSIVSYSWNFGDGTTGSGAVVSHTYNSANTYWATLTVTDNQGATDTDQAYVEVLPVSGSDGAHYFSKRFGGTGADIGFSTSVDPATGDILVTGYFSGSVNFGGSQNLVSQGSTDIFLARYTADGNFVWARRFGGIGSDRGLGIALSNGEISITGSFSDSVDFGGVTRVSRGGTDIFLARYTSQGTLRWVHGLGSTGTDSGNAVAVGSDGSVTVAGSFYYSIDFGGGALTSGGASDIFVAKYLASSGAHMWSARYGAPGIDAAYGVAMHTDDILLTGVFTSAISFGGPTVYADSIDLAMFVAKFSTSNGYDFSHSWSRGMGGTRSDYGKSVVADTNGDVLLAGRVRSSSVDFGGSSPAALGSEDMFLAKYRGTTGSLLWVRRTGGTSSDDARAVTVDGNNNAVVTGKVDNPATLLGELYVAKYSPAGVELWTHQMPGNGSIGGAGVAADADGMIVVTGHFDGAVDFGGGMLSSYGSVDLFLLKLWP